MTRLDDRRPSLVFACNGGDEFDANLREIPFGSKIFNTMKRELEMLKTESQQGQIQGMVHTSLASMFLNAECTLTACKIFCIMEGKSSTISRSWGIGFERGGMSCSQTACRDSSTQSVNAKKAEKQTFSISRQS